MALGGTVACTTARPVSPVGKVIESGVASWYGPQFHGKRTANGEVYDMFELTAAHRKLPFGTVVEVHSLDTGKSIVVRINDR
ncbi:MAG: septal ring lytic transglycosylase RlpA family protein, partial [Acidobacteria bacterium]|nr:septal ring lytic transglycosylase RlpA family protein [Acidobacteriota bacterium]